MCAGCGILQNNQDWTEGFGLHNHSDRPINERLAERRRRLALVNDLLKNSGLTLREQGSQLVLSSATGGSAVVSNLAHVWMEADRLGRRPVDPLDF